MEPGGEGNLNPMQALLASLAACEVDVIATHAAPIGVRIEGLGVEATGQFGLRSHLGVEDAPGRDTEVTYRARVRAQRRHWSSWPTCASGASGPPRWGTP